MLADEGSGLRRERNRDHRRDGSRQRACFERRHDGPGTVTPCDRFRQAFDGSHRVDETGADGLRREATHRDGGFEQAVAYLLLGGPRVSLPQERRDGSRVRGRRGGAAEAPNATHEPSEEGRTATIGGGDIGLGNDFGRRKLGRGGDPFDRSEVMRDRAPG